MTTTTRAVAYYRMSSDGQEASIPEQTGWAKQACSSHQLTLVRSFEDPGIPGSEVEQRPGLMAMLDFCDRRYAAGEPVGVLVCWDLDRLSRADSLRTAGIVCRLIDAGVNRVLTPEGWTDFNSDMDRVLMNLRQDLSRSAYSKSVSKNVSRGMADRAKRGLYLGGPIPYGYILGDDGRLALGDPADVEAVKWMFMQYAATADSLASLANQLRKRGVRPPHSPRGAQRWTRDNVRRILMNVKYTGRGVWNQRHDGKYHKIAGGAVKPDADAPARDAAKRSRKLKRLPGTFNAPEDYIVFENAHQAIVDEDLFSKVQARMKSRYRKHTTPQAGGGDWLLSGLLFCGACGGVMYGKSTRCRRGPHLYVYRRYVCGTTHKLGRGHCNSNGVEQSGVLKEVAKLIHTKIATPENLQLLRERIGAMLKAGERDLVTRRKELQRRIEELAGQIATATRNMALSKSATTFERIEQLIAEWGKEKAAAAAQLAVLETNGEDDGAAPGERFEEALAELEGMKQVIDQGDPAKIRAALQSVVRKVTLTFRQKVRPEGGGMPGAAVETVKVELTPGFANLLGAVPRGC